MGEVSLAIPQAIVDSLPDESETTVLDMERAVDEWERQINESLETEDDTGSVVDVIERFEQRWELYDEYAAELRAWGQSPIYAIAWRNLHGSLIQQLYEHERLRHEIDRERHSRIVQGGIGRDS